MSRDAFEKQMSHTKIQNKEQSYFSENSRAFELKIKNKETVHFL